MFMENRHLCTCTCSSLQSHWLIRCYRSLNTHTQCIYSPCAHSTVVLISMPYWLATRHWYTPDSGTSNSWITTRDLPDPPLLVTSFSDASSTAMPSWIIFPFQYHRWIGFGTPLKRHSTARSDAGGMAWGPLPLPTLLSSESTQGRAAWRKHGHYWNLKLKCTCENYRDSLPELH